ncbi:PBSX family phage terminase large subunit [Corynebacterium sp. TAE3-ERU16]|uniref:PBSX family phage terminase large subunit n=1 Tax=Corynebacterium sp. TAE3-ERU16 TaxID=2849493 RepID=UPI00351D8C39
MAPTGLSPRQKLALRRSTAAVNIWYGSVRSGKTHASLWWLLYKIAGWDGQGTVLVVGLTLGTVWRNIFRPLLSEPAFAAVAPYITYRENGGTARIFGKEINVVGANDETSWQRIQGMTVAYCLGDEATNWPRSFWDMMITRLSMDTSTMLVTCNPGQSAHYLKTEWIDKADTDPDIHVEKLLLTENPTLPASFVKRLPRLYTGVFYRRYVLGEWVAAEGAIYEQWDPTAMTIAPEKIPRIAHYLSVGIDYGTNHPTAGYVLAMGEDQRLYITHEWSPNTVGGKRRRLTDGELADSLETWLAGLPAVPRDLYVDPAAASFREELKSRRLPSHAADNAVVDGIRTVDSLLVSGDLRISTECGELIREIPGYRWDDKAAARGRDAPIKENDDHCDALRYTVHSNRGVWRRFIPPA